MARANNPIKTKYQNIYEVVNSNGDKNYLATWTQKGRQYPQKNFTKLYGAKTAKQASTILNEIKVLISKGEDPFKKEEYDLNKTFSELVKREIHDRSTSDQYKYTQEKVYMKHIHPLIGQKRLQDITIDTIFDIFKKLKKTESDDTIINLKKTINPTLDFAVDEGLIDKNPLSARKVKKLTKASKKMGKVPLKHRLTGMENNRYLDAASTFYKAALNISKTTLSKNKGSIPDIELQIAFLFVLMTGRRRSEVLNVKYSDITPYGTVKTRIETTKTGVWEEYPLPQEVLERLSPKGEEYIVPSLSQSTYSEYMRAFIDNLDIPLHNNMKLDGHDTRNLFLTIMSKETKNPFLCDAALSHSKSKYKMLATYYEPDLEDYIELFNHYWDLLRGERQVAS